MAETLYLVSNSKLHEDNTCNKFCVTFDKPIDLTGKEMALSSMTYTKSLKNVDGEEMTLVEGFPLEKKDHVVTKQLSVEPRQHAHKLKDFANHLKKFFLFEIPPAHRESLNSKNFVSPTFVTYRSVFETTESRARAVVSFNLKNNTDTIVRLTTKVKTSEEPDRWHPILLPPNVRYLSDGGLEVILPKGEELKFAFSVLSLYFELEGEHYLSTPMDQEMDKLFLLLTASWTEVKQKSDVLYKVTPQPGFYNNAVALVQHLNDLSSFKRLAKIETAGDSNTFKLVLKNDKIKEVRMGGLQHQLGFSKEVLEGAKIYSSDKTPDMSRGTHNIFIYADCLNETRVNEQRVPILALVDAAAGRVGEQTVTNISNLIYVPCVSGLRHRINIEIANDVGETNFLIGRTTLSCILRKSL